MVKQMIMVDVNEKQVTVKDSYLVEGMSCTGCERTITRVVSNLPGVSSAKADLKQTSVSFEYNPNKITVNDIKHALNRIGYKILDKTPPRGKEDQRDGCCS